MFATQKIREPFNHTFSCIIVWITVWLACGATAAATDQVVPVNGLPDLRRVVQARHRTSCDVNLEGIVCASDPARGLLILQDASGVDVCALDLGGRVLHPGERVRISAGFCEVIRRKWSAALATAPVVDNGGIHAVSESSGKIYLNAGDHPIQVFYFNAKDPAVLEISYAGSHLPMQPIPTSALFQCQPDAAAPNDQRTPGLKYFCYADNPATLDHLRNKTPIHSGIATNFDINLRQPRDSVAMLFQGRIEIPREGEYEFTVRSDDAGELYVGNLTPVVTVLSSNIPPIARRLSAREPVSHDGACEWATIEGSVTFVGKDSDGLEIELKEGSQPTRLWLPSHRSIPQALLLNARVRATGAYRNVDGLDGQSHLGMISVVGETNLRILGIAPEQWEKYPLATTTNLTETRNGTGINIAHLRGTVTQLRADGEFVLDDGAGKLLVKALDSDGLTNGLVVEVLGGIARTATGLEVGPAFWRRLEFATAALPELTTAAQVQQLSAQEAARQYPVLVRGVVSCQVEWSGAVIQDSTRGVFFHYEPSYRDGLETGDFVEIRGTTAVGDFAPIINAQSIRVLGPGQMPEPVRPNWNQLMSGSLDSQYAEVRGIITDVEGNRVTLLTDGGKIKVVLHNTGEAALKRLLNTLVRIRGGLFALWDAQTRQVRVGEIKFWNPKIEIDQLPMAEPFSAPVKTISDLLLFDLNASGFQRVKISGQVVHVRGDELFLMQDGKGLRFRLTEKSDLKPGDLVDVVGIPELSGPSPRLHEAVARKTGEAGLPPAQTWPDAENAGAKLDATRVETIVKLIGIHRTGTEWVMEVQTGLRAYRALVSTPDNLAEALPLDSRLKLSGVYAIQGGGKNDELSAFELLLNSAADIRLIERPPWWTLRRLLYIVATLIAVLTAAAIWINQLQRQVAHRTRLLEREHARREHAERERALELERSRIARDLHDDLGSSLTEIHVMASAGLRMKDMESKSPPLFNAITEKARSLIAALDVIVWAVDPEANSLQSLADYLSGYADEYLAHSGIACRFKIPASLPSVTLDGRIRHDLFLAVKETLHNVVRHSQATEVEFQLTVGEGAIDISISDNGAGFKVEGMKDGHGLKNISGRLNKIGGRCQMESLAGVGTKVSISLPLPATKENESVPPA